MPKRQTKADDVAKLKFEEAIGQLEHLVEQIESGEVGLEEALAQYERGIALIKRCRTVLSAAEQRIAELTTTADGDLALTGDGDADDDLLTADEDEDDNEAP